MKATISLLLVLVILSSFSLTAFADDAIIEPNPEPFSENSVQPLAEEKEWVYRVYNGNLERRLWSNTYGVWLTDWEIVGPAP